MNTDVRPRRYSFLLVLLMAWLGSVPAAAQGFQWPERAENLEVLPEDTSPEQLSATMLGFSQALGVRCSHCHDDSNGSRLADMDFAADTKEEKDIARIMLRMVRRINDEELAPVVEQTGGRVAVTCITCHRGVAVPPRLLEDELAAVIERDGIEAAIAHYHELRRRYEDSFAYDFRVNRLNTLGYRLLRQGRVDEALAIFKLNVEMYPEHWNGYDSLAEAYMTKGEMERAVALYQRSLALNPDNDNAVQMLRQIEGE